ncbi:2-(1,2-epoxy-1,2-dihydrophenyl)acetyl-CoA isomerase [Runella defluvii]|uniref:2-(1,2-epoxy-1,2-dihydrophenyl)acetyl-CoA isomerase n=1 Tax=Runella defluvii TaxID=370973 RepID=A0A7W5ZHX8_9BACT|nr:enoyl-CoA hydratase-related protein [Runella defluvii]MBB3836950.1 2-(1,2-epoxy-1,2-dihydrophenyl)acetyl-CoA isomerase [Runella defluvii]
MFEYLTYEVNDGVARITLNRPQVYNALSAGLLKEMTRAIETTAADETVRVVVITGAGDKAFCSGADLKEGMGGANSLGDSLRQNYNPLILAIRSLPKPIICRLNGVAAGAGCSLALACDLVIATEEAYLSQIFVNIGLMPDAGSTFFLPRLVGMQKAFEIASTGRKVSAIEAAQIGLIHKAVPASELDVELADIVSYYQNAPTRSIGAMKQVMNQAMYSTLDQMLELEATHQDQLGRTHDAAEGIMAFLQKRKAAYRGK